jgi:hypothetical protein
VEEQIEVCGQTVFLFDAMQAIARDMDCDSVMLRQMPVDVLDRIRSNMER